MTSRRGRVSVIKAGKGKDNYLYNVYAVALAFGNNDSFFSSQANHQISPWIMWIYEYTVDYEMMRKEKEKSEHATQASVMATGTLSLLMDDCRVDPCSNPGPG